MTQLTSFMYILFFFWKDCSSQFIQRDMNCAPLPLRVHGEQTACEELEDVFEEGSVSSSERMILNGPVTKREKCGLVLAPET